MLTSSPPSSIEPTPNETEDDAFAPDERGLKYALQLLLSAQTHDEWLPDFPEKLPCAGIGEYATLGQLAPAVLGGAQRLGAPTAFAHMNPPTPWITWAVTQWNAALNQNLLHPETGPVARASEELVLKWLSPYYGMDGGHMTSGSTLANLTALWVARELHAIKKVVASSAAHFSVRKAANLLGLELVEVRPDSTGAIDTSQCPADLDDACLVLTAGTTSLGAIDALELAGRAAWTHVDAAWAGPLKLSRAHAHKLSGVEGADSLSMSAHKLLFQPKESAIVMFRRAREAHSAISFEAGYLSAPNVGILGSHGAAAVPLMATLMAWGREGMERRIDRCVAAADRFAEWIDGQPDLELCAQPQTGIVVWRTRNKAASETLIETLPAGSTSLTTIDGGKWLRNVAANPNVDTARLIHMIRACVDAL